MSLALLVNFALAVAILAGKAFQAVFLGKLRANEVERVSEALKFAFPEVRCCAKMCTHGVYRGFMHSRH